MNKAILITSFACIFYSQVFSQQTKFVKSSDGVNIAYQVYGKGNIPLVFVHGWCCDKSYWDAQTNYFKNQYKIVTIDLAGHGESGLGRKSYTIPMFANDVSAVLNQLRLKKIILIGHSLGAAVVVETAVSNLDKTLAIFSIDGLTDIPNVKSKEEIDTIKKKVYSELTEQEFKSKVYNWVLSLQHPESDSALIKKCAMDMSMNDPFVAIDVAANNEQWYYQDYPNSIKLIKNIPIISISSTGKPIVEEFKNYGVNFQDFRMEGLSHFLQMSNPVEFNKIFGEQLNKTLKSKAPQ
jgi:pimeloyl-ACP methyl ester carboxylesterase